MHKVHLSFAGIVVITPPDLMGRRMNSNAEDILFQQQLDFLNKHL